MTSRWFKLYCAYFISLLKFVKCWQFFLESNSKRLYRSSGKEKESSLVFTSSTIREIMHFHVVVVQWRERCVQKSVMHVQSCCFANLNQLLFCRSSWRRCRPCLNALLISLGNFFWSGILKHCTEIQEKKKKLVFCSRPPQNVKLRISAS